MTGDIKAARAGSFCAPLGAEGRTTRGVVLVCSVTKPGERARMRRPLPDTDAGITVPAADPGTPPAPAAGPATTPAPAAAAPSPTSPTPAPSPAETADRIRQAYYRLVAQPGDWLFLSDLRAALPDLPRADFDAAVRVINAADGAVAPESNQKVLTDAQRAGAIYLGNQHKHLISIRPPVDTDARARVTNVGVAAASDTDLAMALRDPRTASALYDAIRAEQRRRSTTREV